VDVSAGSPKPPVSPSLAALLSLKTQTTGLARNALSGD